LSQDRSIPLIGAELIAQIDTSTNSNSYGAIAAALQDAVVNPYLNYVATSRQLALARFNSTADIYHGSEMSLQGADRIVYQNSIGFASWAQPGPNLGPLPSSLRYTVIVVQNQQPRNAAGRLDSVERRYVGGAATVSGDVPTSGSGSYTVVLTGASARPTGGDGLIAQNAQLTVDFAARTVTGTVIALSSSSPSAGERISLLFQGQLAADGRISGGLTSADGATGRFTGQLYGPAGGELGLAFALQRDTLQGVGTVAGLRR
jgi:hypothetical protein